jgi:hypothetical protein
MRHRQLLLSRVERAALAIVLLLLAAPGRATTRGPDRGGYTATDAIVYSFVDVAGSGGAASILRGADDATAPLTLPFPFRFYGRTYSVVCASSNGALYFVQDAGACTGLVDFANVDLASTATPNDLAGAFPLWSDLTFEQAGSGAVFYQTLGAAGSRRFVVQWNDAYPTGSPSPVTFQIILSEETNSLVFQYKTVDLGEGNAASRGAAATIGIRDAGGLATQQFIAWSANAGVVANDTALLFSATVADHEAPVLSGLNDIVAEATGPNGSIVTFAPTARDNVDGNVAVICTPASGSTFRLGNTSVACSARDASGNVGTGSFGVTVRDTTPPSAPTLTVTPSVLHPPNHKLVPVVVTARASDAVSTAACAIVSITSNEPDTRPGEDDRPNDIVKTGALTANLRAERIGEGNGRIYTITVGCTDAAGNAGATSRVTVTVPHERGGRR